MLYALTINPGHSFFGNTCIDVLNTLILELRCEYANIVFHANDHYHALLSVDGEITKEYASSRFHFETVRNPTAYIKYMHNHDLTGHIEMGEMPYFEKDSIVDYIMLYGPVKAVQKFGWDVLKQYKNIKEFYEDIKKEGQ